MTTIATTMPTSLPPAEKTRLAGASVAPRGHATATGLAQGEVPTVLRRRLVTETAVFPAAGCAMTATGRRTVMDLRTAPVRRAVVKLGRPAADPTDPVLVACGPGEIQVA